MTQRTPGNPATSRLHAGDLLDDRELVAAEDDQLAHEGIVAQLADLATTVTTPSNIALYGPWGSGKSGIANLLKNKIDGERGTRFVRFDAFKYADVPLRRNFISAVAGELGCKQPKYHADLYSSRTKTDITIPPTTVCKLLLVFAGLVLGIMMLLAAGVSIIAFAQSRIGENSDFAAEFNSLSGQAVRATLVPATLLAALITLASKTLAVDRSSAKPDSDEQFEEIFKALVSDARAQRLVIFVDELDRCTADEVVNTLDTIRTFLGVDRCIFIVAADQNVLEGALTRAAKQETPADDTNPYYSTGSAYLDKVFQYQLSLPPLLTQSISKYAATLVENRDGLWAEVNREYVLSVLIPTHVTSPRRVKHLLNTFALTYRLAQDRYSAGLLAEDPQKNAPALARLVCLRVEFPLFARHLEIAANLPALVLQLMNDEGATLPAGTSDRAWEIAKSYALNDAAPSTVLVDEETDEDGDDAGHRATEVGRAHNKQLLNYLGRTRPVQGPSRDLIYMQSTGTVFGLDGELALAVERAAEDADLDSLQRRVDGLDEPAREGVLRVLTNQIRTGGTLTGSNAARSFLLLAAADPTLPVVNVADTVVEAICVLDETSEFLDESTAASAWALAKIGSEESSAALRRRIITAATQPGFSAPQFIFDDAVMALEASPEEVTNYLSARIVSAAGPEVIARLFELSDGDLIKVITTTRSQTSTRARSAARAHLAWKANQKPAEQATASTAAATREPDPEPFDPSAVINALEGSAGVRETPLQHLVLGLLLAIDATNARTAALRLLGKTQPVDDHDLVTSVLEATTIRVFSEWTNWLGGIAPSAISADHADELDTLVTKLWDEELDLDVTRATLEGLTPLFFNLSQGDTPSLTFYVLDSFDSHVADTSEAKDRRDILERARIYASSNVIDYAQILYAVARSLQDTLAETIEPVDADDALYLYLMENGTEAVRECAAQLEENEVRGLLTQAAASPWLDNLGHVEVPLELAEAAGMKHVRLADLPTVATMAYITDQYEDSAVHAAARWFELVRPNPDDFSSVYAPLLRVDAHAPDLVKAAHQVQRGWTTEQHRALLDRYLAAADPTVPSDSVLDMLGLADADENQVTDLLIIRHAGATNNTQRQAVLTLWAKAKIKDGPARKRLVEGVIYQLLDLNAGDANNVSAVELALNALSTVGKPLPPRIKTELGKRVQAAVKGNNSLEKKALAVMPALGYRISSGLFGMSKRVNYGS